MSWRTVIIADRAKIDYAMGYMAVRGRDVRKVFMDEIGTVVIESTAVSLTAAWVSECLRRKIKIIFCDGKHDPAGEVIPYYGSGDTSRKVREQAKWTAERKAEAWQCVIREKIRQQAAVLREFGFDEDAGQLDEYREGVQPGDRDNREGQAAKVYFHALCGRGFPAVTRTCGMRPSITAMPCSLRHATRRSLRRDISPSSVFFTTIRTIPSIWGAISWNLSARSLIGMSSPQAFPISGRKKSGRL